MVRRQGIASFAKGLVNVATDPSVILGIGTAILGSGLGGVASAINWGMVGLAAVVRTGTEVVNAGKGQLLPDPVRNFLKNRGAALEVRGASYVVSSLVGLLRNDMHDTVQAAKTAILSLFGGGMFFRGRALGYSQNTPSQRWRDGGGSTAVLSGCFLMAAEQPAAVMALMGVSGAISLTQTFNAKVANAIGKYQAPDLILGTAFLATAATTDNPVLMATNIAYGAGYIASLPLNRLFGGVAQAGEALINKLRPAKATTASSPKSP